MSTPVFNFTKKQRYTLALVAVMTVGASIISSVQITLSYTERQVREAVEKVLADRERQAKLDLKDKKMAAWAAASNDVPTDKNIYGSLGAQFTLVEYSDFECQFCKRFHDTPKQLVDQSENKVNWEWQHFPLDFHNPAALLAAHAAECVSELAGNQAFWAFTGEWFSKTALNGRGVGDLFGLTENLGIPSAKMEACISSGKYNDKIKAHIERGVKMGVTGTPATVVVDNTTGKYQLVKGAQPASAFIDAMRLLVSQRSDSTGETQ